MAHRTLIDWSRWQDDDRTAAFPDLAVAAARGVDGHLFKAGRGHDPDPDFARFVAEAVRTGQPWGAYWWPEPCPGAPPAPAGQWEQWIGGRQPDLPRGWSSSSGWQFSAQGSGVGRTYGAESVDPDLNVVRREAWTRWTRRPTTAPAMPVVREGSRGTHVAIVQTLVNVHLGAAGRTTIAESGDWPPGTSTPTAVAVRWFQSDKGLAPDRIIGPKTWAALLAVG